MLTQKKTRELTELCWDMDTIKAYEKIVKKYKPSKKQKHSPKQIEAMKRFLKIN